MKKAISLLFALLLSVCVFQTFAYADVVEPVMLPEENNSMLPVILIAAAVIVVAVVIWKIRHKKT